MIRKGCLPVIRKTQHANCPATPTIPLGATHAQIRRLASGRTLVLQDSEAGVCGGPGPQPDPTPNPPRVWDLSVGFVPVPAAPAGFDHLFIWIHVAGISAAQSNTSNSIVFDGGPSSGNCTLGPVLTNHVCFGSVVSWSSTTGTMARLIIQIWPSYFRSSSLLLAGARS